MSIFSRKKKENVTRPTDTGMTEFDRDIKELLARDDIQSRQDICNVEYKKALSLLENPNQEKVHRAYDLMGNLASV